MIITEFYKVREDGVNLYRTHSDSGFMIQNESGALYEDAIDVENSGHTYTETDQPIAPEEITDTEALDILLGRDGNE